MRFDANKPPAGGISHGDEVDKFGRSSVAERADAPPEDEERAIADFLSRASQESFHRLFRALAPRLIGYFRARGVEVELAEDLTQDVMWSVYRQARSLRQKESFRPWLYRIARNALLRHLRDTGRRISTVALDDGMQAAYDGVAGLVLRSQFVEWMQWLSPEERQIMMLRYVDELEHHEIAELLGMPLGTVQWKIFHTKRKLAAQFGRV